MRGRGVLDHMKAMRVIWGVGIARMSLDRVSSCKLLRVSMPKIERLKVLRRPLIRMLVMKIISRVLSPRRILLPLIGRIRHLAHRLILPPE